MSEKPILFSTELVKAIAEGRKTQTRRVAKDSNKCPYAADRLWVRETWRPKSWGEDFDWMMLEFKAGGKAKEVNPWEVWGDSRAKEVWQKLTDEMKEAGCRRGPQNFWIGPEEVDPIKWRSSIFLPRAGSRTTLKVLSFSLQPLDRISEQDAIAEGIPANSPDPIGDFRKLWDSINAKRGYGWEVNPMVWVVEFACPQQSTAIS